MIPWSLPSSFRRRGFWFSGALPALVLLFLLLPGCGGGASGVPPTLVHLGGTPEPVHSFVPGVHRYVESDTRMVFPTDTPVPVPTQRPTPELSRLLLPTVTPAPGFRSGIVDRYDGATLSCVDEYRLMLIDYDGRIPFGTQVAYLLSENFKLVRPDCAERGWAPEFEANRVCVGARIADIPLSLGLVYRSTPVSPPAALPTTRDDSGSMLVHFGRMPFEEVRGCWYYNVGGDAWAWLISGGPTGVDRPRFPVCDRRLQELMASVPPHDFTIRQIARVLDQVRMDLPEPCGSLLWNVFPSPAAHDGCRFLNGTGVSHDGSLVVSWHEEYLPADNSVCWIMDAGSDSWEFNYPLEGDDDGRERLQPVPGPVVGPVVVPTPVPTPGPVAVPTVVPVPEPAVAPTPGPEPTPAPGPTPEA